MDKAQEILWHIEELYSEKPSQFKVEQMCKSNPTRFQAWVDAFKDYDLSDVLTAIDNYWEFKNSKTRPNVAQIKAILNTHKAEKEKQVAPVEEKQLLPTPSSLMDVDVENGDCRNNLYVYNAAFELVIKDWLAEILPADVYARTGYPQNVQLALNNGLFNRFNEALRIVAQKKFGRDYEFPSANDLLAQKNTSGTVERFNPVATLAAHWGV